MNVDSCSILGSLSMTTDFHGDLIPGATTLDHSGAVNLFGRLGLERAMGFCSAAMKARTVATAPAIPPNVRLSVHDRGAFEAQRFKWIESEKAGHDLGEWAIRCWVRHHWNGFLREKWLEHLEGRAFWIELDHDDFGLLIRSFEDSRLINEITWRLKAGHENLDILNWAIDSNQKMEEVFEILEVLDMNSRRIECLLEARLAYLL